MYKHFSNSASGGDPRQADGICIRFFRRTGLAYLNEHAHEAVLILSDINMPGMSGLEPFGHIKQKYHKPPPVMMMITAYGDEENYQSAMRLGADDFLTKPVEFNLLKEN